MFKELKKGEFESIEKEFIDYWKENNILQNQLIKVIIILCFMMDLLLQMDILDFIIW